MKYKWTPMNRPQALRSAPNLGTPNNISFVNCLRFPERCCEIKNLMTGKRRPGRGYMVGTSIVSVTIKTSLLLLIRARELADDIEFTSSKVHNITTLKHEHSNPTQLSNIVCILSVAALSTSRSFPSVEACEGAQCAHPQCH